MVCGDEGYGPERMTAALEESGQDYVFKLAIWKGVKQLVGRLGEWLASGESGVAGGRGGTALRGLDGESAGGGVETTSGGDAGAEGDGAAAGPVGAAVYGSDH